MPYHFHDGWTPFPLCTRTCGIENGDCLNGGRSSVYVLITIRLSIFRRESHRARADMMPMSRIGGECSDVRIFPTTLIKVTYGRKGAVATYLQAQKVSVGIVILYTRSSLPNVRTGTFDCFVESISTSFCKGRSRFAIESVFLSIHSILLP